MIKVGLIGCGSIANAHAEGWLAMQEQGRARVTAVSDVVAENAERMARRLGASAIYQHFEDLIHRADVDAVDICLPHHLHEPAIVAAANAGKHILCEKPLCLTLAEAASIARAVESNGVTMMCAHNQLFDPAVQRGKQVLAEGVLGEVLMVRTTDCFRHPQPPEKWGWRADKATMGGGCLIDTGYHPTYLLLYLSDSPPVEVCAMTGQYHVKAIQGEDSAQVMVRFANGSLGYILTSWAWDWPGGAYQFQVIGSRAQVYGRGNRLYLQPNGWQPASLELPARRNFVAEIEHFVECLETGRRPLQTHVEGTNVLRLILAAYRSVEERRVVALAELE